MNRGQTRGRYQRNPDPHRYPAEPMHVSQPPQRSMTIHPKLKPNANQSVQAFCSSSKKKRTITKARQGRQADLGSDKRTKKADHGKRRQHPPRCHTLKFFASPESVELVDRWFECPRKSLPFGSPAVCCLSRPLAKHFGQIVHSTLTSHLPIICPIQPTNLAT